MPVVAILPSPQSLRSPAVSAVSPQPDCRRVSKKPVDTRSDCCLPSPSSPRISTTQSPASLAGVSAQQPSFLLPGAPRLSGECGIELVKTFFFRSRSGRMQKPLGGAAEGAQLTSSYLMVWHGRRCLLTPKCRQNHTGTNFYMLRLA